MGRAEYNALQKAKREQRKKNNKPKKSSKSKLATLDMIGPKQQWEGYYSIESIPEYIHSSFNRAQYILEKNTGGPLETTYKKVSDSVKKSIVSILDEIIGEWVAIQKEFIKKGVEAGISDSTNPKKFLIDYNKKFKEITHTKLTGNVIEMKKQSLIFSDLESKTTKAIKSKNYKKIEELHKKKLALANKNWSLLINFFLDAIQFYENQNQIWKAFMVGETKEEFDKRIKEKMPINLIEIEIKKILNSMGFESSDNNKIINDLRKIKEKIKVGNDTTTKEQMLTMFTGIISNNFPSAAGTLLEYTAQVDLKENEIFSNMIGFDDSDIRKPYGKRLGSLSVGDVLISTITIGTQEYKLFSSFKLRKRKDIDLKYDVTAKNDPLFSPKIKLNKMNRSTLQWIRQNIISTTIYSDDQNSSQTGSFYESNFYNLERNMALWGMIPRILDGVYEYGETVIMPSYKNSKIHTALYFSVGEFYWMLDILIGLRKLLATGSEEQIKKRGIAPRSFVPNALPISYSDLKELHDEKRKAINDLASAGQDIDYKKLARRISLGKISSKFNGWTPIKSVTSVVRYSKLIK